MLRLPALLIRCSAPNALCCGCVVRPYPEWNGAPTATVSTHPKTHQRTETGGYTEPWCSAIDGYGHIRRTR